MYKSKQQRYVEIESRSLIREQKVDLKTWQYEEFQASITKKRWKILAELETKFNEEIVKEFYANSWPTKQHEITKVSQVRRVQVKYDRDTINKYLGEPTTLPEDGRDTYQRMTRQHEFNNDDVANLLCIPDYTYEVGTLGKALRILRPNIRTLTQIWTNFSLDNVIPKTHLSYINMGRAYLIWCIIQGLQVDAVAIISDEMQKVITSAFSFTGSASRLSGFPALIIGLCKFHGVHIPTHPVKSIQPPINKVYIVTHCTNPLEEVQGLVPRHQPPSKAPITELMTMHFTYLEQQQVTNQQPYTSLNDYFYMLTIHQHQHPIELFPWLSPTQFSQHVAQLGDNPIFPGGMEAVGADADARQDVDDANEGRDGLAWERHKNKQHGDKVEEEFFDNVFHRGND